MKNVFCENLFAYPYQNKKSDKIFLLENCVWISISLTKKKKVQKPANEEGKKKKKTKQMNTNNNKNNKTKMRSNRKGQKWKK